MTDLELAEEIERKVVGIGPGFYKELAFKPHQWQQIIAALRRGPERPDVNDLLDFIEAVAVKLMVPLVPRDGFSKRILDKLDWLILALNKYSEEDILQERPLSGEMAQALKICELIASTGGGAVHCVEALRSAAEAEVRKPYAHVIGACPLCGRTDPHSHTSGPLGMS